MSACAFPLSFAQERFWLIQQLDRTAPTFNISMALRLNGPVDTSALRTALDTVVERHDALRTSFPVIDGRPVQMVEENLPLTLSEVDLGPMPADRRAHELSAQLEADSKEHFDLEADRLIRATLIRLGDREHVLAVSVHHIICDGWSLDIFLREFTSLYSAQVEGSPVHLAPIAIQYPDYSVWQREYCDTATFEAELEYWRAKLAGVTRNEIPRDMPNQAAHNFAGGRHTFEIPADVMDKLRVVAAEEHATMFMMILAAFTMLLARLQGQEDVVVGTSVAGRTRPELEPIIGCFLNTVALRTDLSGDPSYLDVLKRVRTTSLEAFELQEVPFERVVAALDVARDLSRTPLFQTMLVLQNAPAEDVDFAGLTGSFEPRFNGTAKVDLMLDVVESGGALACTFEYLTSAFTAETVRRAGRQLTRIFEAVAGQPGVRLSELRLASLQERQAALGLGARNVLGDSQAMTVGQLVDVQADRLPNAPAVVSDDGRLTYQELRSEAHKIADALLGSGLRADEPVAVSLASTGRLAAPAVLAPLIAGGALAVVDDGEVPRDIRFVVTPEGDDVRITALPVDGTPEPAGSQRTGYAVTAAAAADAVYWARGVLSSNELAMVTPFTEDPVAVGWSILLPLCWGGSVLIPSADPVASRQTPSGVTLAVTTGDDGQDHRYPGTTVSCRILTTLEKPLSRQGRDKALVLYAPWGVPCAGAVLEGDSLAHAGLEPFLRSGVFLLDSCCEPVVPGQPGQVYLAATPSIDDGHRVAITVDGRPVELVPTGDRALWTTRGRLASAMAGRSATAGTAGSATAGSATGLLGRPDESAVADIWREVLGLDRIARDANFFDLGGHSLGLVRVQAAIAERLGRRLELLDLFANPTVESLARFLSAGEDPAMVVEHPMAHVGAEDEDPAPSAGRRKGGAGGFEPMAIIGMACRFPEADGYDQYWRNLVEGVDATRVLSDEELLAAGVGVEEMADPSYVRRVGVVDGVDMFDAAYFGLAGRETELIDPQQRVFLETAHDALQDAGYDPDQYSGRVGVFGGIGLNLYGWENVAANSAELNLTHLQALIAVEKDHTATRTAYRLNLRGPALTIQTACSTSLVSVNAAVQALSLGECDLALAGGTNVAARPTGYRYVDGGTLSPDGRCRAFDADAKGPGPGMGSGFVVLRPLAAALAAGDTVHAVISACATNNDGSDKVGYTAPSLSGQERVLRTAYEAGKIDPRTVGCLEAHGTGTALGDPIEVAALVKAFGPAVDDEPWCALGSVKTAIGHLDAAAGIAGLIKAVLSVQRGLIPPSLHFRSPNPGIGFASSPFFVNAQLRPWPESFPVRRAGVSAFGIGGTNAHVVVDQPPAPREGDPAAEWQLIVLSAATPAALERSASNLADHLASHAQMNLADVGFTLQVGRRAMPCRLAVVARDLPDLVHALRARDDNRVIRGVADRTDGVVHPRAGFADGPRHGKSDGDERAAWLRRIADAWAAGADVNWQDLHAGTRRCRVSLPTYAFDKRRYYVEPARMPESPTVSVPVRRELSDALYLPSWRRASASPKTRDSRYLVVCDSSPLAGDLVAELRSAGADVVLAGPGAAAASAGCFADLSDLTGMTELFETLRRESSVPSSVVHCVGPGSGESAGYRSLVALARVLASGRATEVESLVVVTDGGQAVAGETGLDPEAAMSAALVHVMNQELGRITSRVVDVATGGGPSWAVARRAVAEIRSQSSDVLVALRDADRWTRGYEPLQTGAAPSLLRERGVYILFGGTGTVGRGLARFLAERFSARLVLVRRSPLAADTDHAFISSLEELGAVVHFVQGDVGDRADVQRVVEETERLFGAVSGVVNASGVVAEGYAALLADLDAEVCERNFRSKVDAAAALEAVFADRGLDFCVLSGSLSAVLGGLGYGAYAAGNAYIDAFVESLRRRRDVPWIAIDWDAWGTADAAGVGPAADLAVPLTSVEAAELFERILVDGFPARAVVSKSDLSARLAAWVDRDLGGARDHDEKEDERTAMPRYPRPDLKTVAVAPRTETESVIAAIWADVLGLDAIGVFDDFFELGGDSLLALRVVELMERSLKRPVSLSAILDTGTIEHLADAMDGDGAAAEQVLVPLGGEGDRNIFLVHPLGGSVLGYRSLVGRLPATLYGLQPPSLVENQVGVPSIGDLAERYLAEATRIQPQGPYLIGGWSIGGTIAVEMAERLLARGDEVAWTGVIDAAPPRPGDDFATDREQIAFGDSEILKSLGVATTTDSVPPVPEGYEQGALSERIERTAQWLVEHRLLSRGPDVERRARMFVVARDNLHAYHRHQPTAFDGRISVFATDSSIEVTADPTLGWGRVVNVEQSMLRGEHETVLEEPQLSELVILMRHSLSRVIGS
ncbi:acyl transferase domain-containing protein/thioesterase domain-containing protein/acyl carrier protein [Catenulispora sp. EB89]|uniref:SDR family NAD(P)-dependent oxidoreductase n=1 Tax=Catenulispora sp. EB89 TaxID=3156257 RepID=UPI0035168F7D